MQKDAIEANNPVSGASAEAEVNKFSLRSSVIGDMLLEQLSSEHTPSISPQDYLHNISQQIDFLMATYSHDPDVIAQIKASKSSLFNTIFDSILLKMHLTREDILCELELESLFNKKAESLYFFDVIFRFENMVNFVDNYITNNQNALLEMFKPSYSKKDLMVTSLRKRVKGFNECVLILSVDDIIDSIISDEHHTESFLDTLFKNNEEMEVTHEIRDLFDLIDLPTQFFSEYFFKPLITDEVTRSVLSGEIVSRLVHRFKK